MRAIDQAATFYKERGLDFAKDLLYYLQHGEVISLTDRFLLAKPAKKDDPMAYVSGDEADAWHIHFACGKGALKRFLADAPRLYPYICWHRYKDSLENGSQRLHVVRTERFSNLV